MDTEESFLSMPKNNDGQVFIFIYIYIYIYIYILQQGNGDIMCMYSQVHILYFLQLKNEDLESVLYHF